MSFNWPLLLFYVTVSVLGFCGVLWLACGALWAAREYHTSQWKRLEDRSLGE